MGGDIDRCMLFLSLLPLPQPHVVATSTPSSSSQADTLPPSTHPLVVCCSIITTAVYLEELVLDGDAVAKNNGSEMSSSSQLVDLEDEADKIVDGMDFGELCDEFECKSSPLVESTARQLLRDILELRQGNRALGVYAVSVNYKDPVRSFTGRDKYKRPLWITAALRNPSVSVQEMVMLSSSILRIRWTIKGMPKSSIVGAVGLLIVMRVDSEFTVNQISGQVIEHQETWDLSASSALAKTFFWGSRRLYAVVEAAKDFTEDFNTRFINDNQNLNNNSSQDIFSDPTGDPTRFFQRDNSFQQDFYQIALFLAVLYFVVQFLRATL